MKESEPLKSAFGVYVRVPASASTISTEPLEPCVTSVMAGVPSKESLVRTLWVSEPSSLSEKESAVMSSALLTVREMTWVSLLSSSSVT